MLDAFASVEAGRFDITFTEIAGGRWGSAASAPWIGCGPP